MLIYPSNEIKNYYHSAHTGNDKNMMTSQITKYNCAFNQRIIILTLCCTNCSQVSVCCTATAALSLPDPFLAAEVSNH